MTGAVQRRILAIEPDPEVRHLLVTVFEENGCEVVVAETAEAASRALEGAVDLILLELILPDADGRTLLGRIREDPSTAAIPVIVVSSLSGKEVRHDCFTLGADGYFERPFDPDALVTNVNVHLTRAEQTQRAALRDQLTGLLNLPGLRGAYQGYSGEQGLVIIDLDGFTEVSDEWGWATAERAAYEIGMGLDNSVPDNVRCSRIGGGEFALVVPERDEKATESVAKGALSIIRGLPLENPERETFRLTASMGLVVAATGMAFDEAITTARARLHVAKDQGGNRIVSEDLPRGTSGTRIVVADDDEIAATLLTHRLEKEGMSVAWYDNGADAFDGVIEDQPDLVILDVKMPRMDGFEVVERLRRTPACADLPVILLTSMGSEADVVRGFELGADDYVLKPFSPIELVARVRRLLMRRRPRLPA